MITHQDFTTRFLQVHGVIWRLRCYNEIMKLLVFDVGGTEIKYGILEDALNISELDHVATPKESFSCFIDLVKDIHSHYKDEVAGIAMAMPGPVDVENGIVEKCGAMRYPHDDHVAVILKEACGCKVVMENDGKAAALAEHRYGCLQGCQNAATFVIGTAVGGGLIINNDIVRGPRFMAGEFSFINTQADRYDMEDQMIGFSCSTSFLLKRYQELSQKKEMIDGRELFKRLENDENAQKALDELCTNIAIQIYNLYFLLDLEKIAIGGGISRQEIVIEKIKEKFQEVVNTAMTSRFITELPIEILPCRFGNEANLIGSYIVYDEYQNKLRY